MRPLPINSRRIFYAGLWLAAGASNTRARAEKVEWCGVSEQIIPRDNGEIPRFDPPEKFRPFDVFAFELFEWRGGGTKGETSLGRLTLKWYHTGDDLGSELEFFM